FFYKYPVDRREQGAKFLRGNCCQAARFSLEHLQTLIEIDLTSRRHQTTLDSTSNSCKPTEDKNTKLCQFNLLQFLIIYLVVTTMIMMFDIDFNFVLIVMMCE